MEPHTLSNDTLAVLVYPAIAKPPVTIDEFAKMDIRIGTIIATEAVPETDKLIPDFVL